MVLNDPSPRVNEVVAVDIMIMDGGTAAYNVPVTLKVSYPNGTNMVPDKTGTTDINGHISISFPLCIKAGVNNVTATVTGASSTIFVTASPQAASNINLKPLGNVLMAGGYPILPDDGMTMLPVVANLTDQWGNPVGGVAMTLKNKTGVDYVFTTDNNGIAGPIYLGPSSIQGLETATASYGSLTSATYTVKFVVVDFSAWASQSVVTAGQNVTATALVMIDGAPYPNIPVTFRLYYMPGVIADESKVLTSGTGRASKVELTMNESGSNLIVVSVDEFGVNANRGLIVLGVNGTPTSIIVSSSVMGNAEPVSGKAFADGSSHYLIVAQLIDAHGNPITDGVDITFTDDDGHVWYGTTNAFGKASIETLPSNYVRNMSVSIVSDNCSQNVNLSYVSGPPTRVFIRALPNVVASSDVDGTGMPSDPHITNISASVTDDWYHPLPGKSVTFSVVSGNATIGPLTGVTDATGTATSIFKLNWTYANGTWNNRSAPVPKTPPFYGTAVVKAEYSPSISATTNIIYTNDSFLSVDSSITPQNATIGMPINISVNITGLGWQVKAKPNDIFLVQDASSSMNWYADVIQDNSFVPNPATTTDFSDGIAVGNIPAGTDYKNNASWYYVGSYKYDKTVGITSLDIMFGWDWKNYLPGTGGGLGTGNTYYLMKVLDPVKKRAWEPNGVTTPGYTHIDISPGYGLTETIWVNDTSSKLSSGKYDIYAYYCKGTIAGSSPYRLSVESNTKRMKAAQDACSAFVMNVAKDDRVGYVPYGDTVTDSQVIPLTSMNLTVDRNTTSAKIQAQGIIGGTNTYLGLQKALDKFNSSSTDPNVKRVIVLVTDGYSYRPDLDKKEAAIASGMGVTIYTVGIGACDEDTLQLLANNTGGQYYHVSNKTDLVNQFINITQYIHEIVASNSQITLISNKTQVNGTWTNSTHYINGSAYKITPKNPVWTSTEPNEPLIGNAANGYSLTWSPGEIHISQAWRLKYQLMVDAVGPDGVIEPISNDSYIWFERGSNASHDYQSFTTYLQSRTVHVTNNATPPGDMINVTITYPTAGMNSTETLINIRWQVNYSAMDWYNQTLYYKYGNGPFVKIADLGGWNNLSSPRSYEYPWDVSDSNAYPPGNYVIRVDAYDSVYSDSATVGINRLDTSGQIILR